MSVGLDWWQAGLILVLSILGAGSLFSVLLELIFPRLRYNSVASRVWWLPARFRLPLILATISWHRYHTKAKGVTLFVVGPDQVGVVEDLPTYVAAEERLRFMARQAGEVEFDIAQSIDQIAAETFTAYSGTANGGLDLDYYRGQRLP